MTIDDFASLAIGISAGLPLGTFYFHSLRRSIETHLQDGVVGQALLWAGLRLGAVGAVFWLLAQWNAVALLAGFGGFMLARHRAQRQTQKQQQVAANA
jgi:F1F0 ATPase subunit 2